MQIALPGVALVTGAASGIGAGLAIYFAKEGCTKLFLVDVNFSGLKDTKAHIVAEVPNVRVEIFQVDIGSDASVERMVDACVAMFGRLDYAINLAGVVPARTPIAETPVAIFDKVVSINQHGTWLCHRAEIRQMLKQDPLPSLGNVRGSIVTVSSLAGLNASSGMSPYSASKHAMVGFAKTDAQDYGPQGIRINVICPGMIDTALFRQTSPPDAPLKLANITPVRRLGNPEDVAFLAIILCSSQATFLQGAVIPCDGGLSLQRGVL
ncbi:uncharacterized protein FPRO_12416 [Fusarium proliferatum ET1]|uniref:Related to dehydrogenase n=1 Tax=Fusarium proliferatum (strain ET1) TaxID=1227346 RepID=A0A1L7W8Q6_FUSPR|nr:uncharacterized protein FPRO_12416 [Fusarium proliferatum ET1]CZR48976.1 related to dehydrogenase [Fusarium proliferatum ET1]